MQTDYDNYQTPDGVTLRMKLSLSVGSVDIHYIGNETYKTFDVTGAAVDDVNTAQSFTKPGTVVISKNAWEMCNQDKCFARLVGKDCAQVLVNKIIIIGIFDSNFDIRSSKYLLMQMNQLQH